MRTARVRWESLTASTSARKSSASPTPRSAARSRNARMSLGRHPPPKPTPARRKRRPIQADRLGQERHVGAGRVADLGHGVDEADLGGEEGVRRDLDELGGGEVHDQARACGQHRGVALVQAGERYAGPPGVRRQSVDDAVRLQRVADGEALPQEFGIPGQHPARPDDPPLQIRGRADRDRRLARHDGARPDVRQKGADGRVDVGEVRGVGVRALRGTYRDEVEAGFGDVPIVGGEVQPSRVEGLPEEAVEARLDEGRRAGGQRRDPPFVAVHRHDVVPDGCHRGGVDRAEVPHADNAQLHRVYCSVFPAGRPALAGVSVRSVRLPRGAVPGPEAGRKPGRRRAACV